MLPSAFFGHCPVHTRAIRYPVQVADAQRRAQLPDELFADGQGLWQGVRDAAFVVRFAAAVSLATLMVATDATVQGILTEGVVHRWECLLVGALGLENVLCWRATNTIITSYLHGLFVHGWYTWLCCCYIRVCVFMTGPRFCVSLQWLFFR